MNEQLLLIYTGPRERRQGGHDYGPQGHRPRAPRRRRRLGRHQRVPPRLLQLARQLHRQLAAPGDDPRPAASEVRCETELQRTRVEGGRQRGPAPTLPRVDRRQRPRRGFPVADSALALRFGQFPYQRCAGRIVTFRMPARTRAAAERRHASRQRGHRFAGTQRRARTRAEPWQAHDLPALRPRHTRPHYRSRRFSATIAAIQAVPSERNTGAGSPRVGGSYRSNLAQEEMKSCRIF